MSTVFDELFNGHAAPVLTETFGEQVVAWEAGQERVTVVNLTTRTSFQCTFDGSDEKSDDANGLRNMVTSVLWVPLSVTDIAQEQKLLVIHSDGRNEEHTVAAFGVQHGAFRRVEISQITQTRVRTGIKL